jgi:Rieske Fe-S protein
VRLKTDPRGEAAGAASADDAFPIAARDERRLDRRRFLCAAGSAAVLAVGGEIAHRRLASRRAPELAVHVTPADLPTRGQATLVAADDGRAALLVQLDADGPPVAFDRRCPHLGCPVLWAAERGRFECPCHHAAFDARTGDVLFGPPRRGLAPATVRNARASHGRS